jgi:hypothetical protein
MHIHMALSRQIPCIIAVACRILRFNLVAGVHVHMNCYSRWLGSARSMTAKTAGCSSRSWCCCWALSHQTSCLTKVAFQALGFHFTLGVHVHLNCYNSWLGYAGTTTTQNVHWKQWTCFVLQRSTLSPDFTRFMSLLVIAHALVSLWVHAWVNRCMKSDGASHGEGSQIAMQSSQCKYAAVQQRRY